MKLYAPAKINLRLKVIGRREDGYHLLSMLNVLCDLYDEIELRETKAASNTLFIADTPYASLLKHSARNTVLDAVSLFQTTFKLEKRLEINLAKYIPCGAGLGGGSSDAAAVLKGMRSLYSDHLENELRLKPQEICELMHEIALKIGSDVPFFMTSGSSIVQGIGEDVQDFKLDFLSEIDFLLVLPEIHISTQNVYDLLRAKHIATTDDKTFLEKAKALQGGDWESAYKTLLSFISNDLEEIAFELSPPLRQIAEELRRDAGLLVAMSGSGSSLFVLSRSSPRLSMQQVSQIEEKLYGYPSLIRRSSFLRA